MDWEGEGLLDGVEDAARDARRRLLDELHEEGVPVEELRDAVREERLVLLPIERELMGPVQFSLRDAAERSGLPADQIAAWQRVVGVTSPEDLDEKVFTEEDLAALRRAKEYLDAGLDLEDIRITLRTLSSATSRVADSVRQVFGMAYLRAGDTEHELARRYAAMAAALTPKVVEDLEYLLRLHLREFARSEGPGMAERLTGQVAQAREMAVGFADVVGFTGLDDEALLSAADRLLELADDHVHKPAQVVKTIGDAVMVVSREPKPLVDSMLDLVQAASEAQDLPALRAGIAWGPASPRAGDWYGGTVNLAARLCQRARSGSVLTTNELRGLLGDGYQWSEAGHKRLKGIDEPVPAVRVRRPEA